MGSGDPTRVAEHSQDSSNAATRVESDADDGAAGHLIGRVLGHYRVKALLGHGGMGTVYEAMQRNPRRQVALKVLNPGLASPSMMRRFEHEAQILGRLYHPGIAQIYEAGSFDVGQGAQPFFAMEYVRGLPLSESLLQHPLDVNQRLRLIVRICRAVQHAHQRAVIHRDLKPANVLVVTDAEGVGQPKILDFGIARVLDTDSERSTRQTDMGQVLGTLAYMSPEQAAGDPDETDTRSDVYSLGVIAFEMLSGRLPHLLRGLKIHEAVALICESEAPRLSALEPDLRGDLDVIVATALAKDRERRYQSVADLAGDIENYLSRRPILARPPSTSYRVRKFVHRNKALVAAAASLVLALVSGFAVSSALYLRAEQHRLLAEERAAQLEQVAAVQAAQLTGMEVAKLGQDLRAGVVESVRAAALRAELPADQVEQRQQALIELLQGADFAGLALNTLDAHIFQPTLQAVERDLAEQPLVQARLLQTLAIAYRDQGRSSDAEAPQRRALQLREQYLGAEDLLTLESLGEFAALLAIQGSFEQAEELSQRLLERRTRVHGPNHADTFRTLAGLGSIHVYQSDFDKALPMLQRALQGLRATRGDAHIETLSALNSLGMAYAFSGEYALAQALLEEALEHYRSEFGEEDSGTLNAMNNLGYLHDIQENFVEAERLYRVALEARRRVSGNEHPQTLTAMNNLAFALSGLGRDEEAEPYYRAALAGRRRVLGDEHPDTIGSMNNLAVELRNMGRLEEAEALGATAVQSARRALPAGHWHIGAFVSHYGATLAELGRFEEAENHLLESWQTLKAGLAEDHTRTRDAAGRVAELYRLWYASSADPEHQQQALLWQARAAGDTPTTP